MYDFNKHGCVTLMLCFGVNKQEPQVPSNTHLVLNTVADLNNMKK